MARDITEGDFMKWDQFKTLDPAVALPAIYAHAEELSRKSRGWYWSSIKFKRLKSTAARLLTFLLGVLGIIAPIATAIWSDDKDKLLWSQLAVIALAAAGLAQLADRVFGWSSGWQRYITTVTAMENLTRRFQLDWAQYVVTHPQTSAADMTALFKIAAQFESELADQQTKETDGWIAEFNTGQSALNDIVRSVRDSAEKAAADARAANAARSKALTDGAIELRIVSKTLLRYEITLDDEAPETAVGLTWARVNVASGSHTVRVHGYDGVATEAALQSAISVVDVLPGGTHRVAVQMD